MGLPSRFRDLRISSLKTLDVRFPTHLTLGQCDAVHKNPDFSAAYVIIYLENCPSEGHGFTFTIGRGNDIVQHAIREFEFLVKGKNLGEIFGDFRKFWKSLTCNSQLRWLGPEKGVVHLAVAAIVNALWDLWAKLEEKPVWKLLADMTPEEIVSLVDFHHITDAITEEEALELLKENTKTKEAREKQIRESGVPAYITSAAWIGYGDELIKQNCQEAIAEGWTAFKMKVGINLEDDIRRAAIVRNAIGDDRLLMVDANQVWDVQEAIDWMKALAKFKPHWIEEPTSPDDVFGHKAIAEALNPLGIGVATGEHCQNRIIFKQFLTQNALQFCQIDSARLGSVNEIIAVLLMAAKYKIPVCPHAGGVGLCEYVQHLAIFNYIYISPTFENVVVEYVDHLHEHFLDPVKVKNARYLAPLKPGYSAEMKPKSLQDYTYPDGPAWVKLRQQGHDQYWSEGI